VIAGYVRFASESGQVEHVSAGPLRDFVAKVGKEQLTSNNAQQSNLDEWIFESTLRIGA
jgi:hypothetical protein